ncbi:MAG: GAF domain-containing protein [Candidatus Binataceae bacterium]
MVRRDVKRERSFPEDERLLTLGIRSYVRAPLFVQEELIGSVAFCRFTSTTDWTAQEIEIFDDVSRLMAAAVSNSLAYSEIGNRKTCCMPKIWF